MRHHPTLLEQAIETLPWGLFDRLVARHRADERCRGFSSRDHLVSLLCAALGGHASLRQTVAAMAPNAGALRLIACQAPARSTLSDAGRTRPAELFIDLFQSLLGVLARPQRQQMREAVRLIDATQLDLGARMQHWLGTYRDHPVGKLHLVYDPRAQRPVRFVLTSAREAEITVARNAIPIEPGTTYVFDRGYYDFAWFAQLDAEGCRFVTRLKSHTGLREAEERETTAPHILADRVGQLNQRMARSRRNPFRAAGREILVRIDTGRILRLFTNDLDRPAEEIAALYKERWQIELFFKWIKQNLRISKFIGTSENAVRSQIAVALIAYLLIAALHARTQTRKAAVTVLALIRAHLFTRRPLADLLDPPPRPPPKPSPQLAFWPRK